MLFARYQLLFTPITPTLLTRHLFACCLDAPSLPLGARDPLGLALSPAWAWQPTPAPHMAVTIY